MPPTRDLQPDFTLQMYEPHRKRPFTRATCSLWASLEPGMESIWSAILYTGSVDLSSRIRSELTNSSHADILRSDDVPEFSDILWPQICVAGVENMQQALRSTLEHMDALVWLDIHVRAFTKLHDRSTKIPRTLQQALPTSAR